MTRKAFKKWALKKTLCGLWLVEDNGPYGLVIPVDIGQVKNIY